MDAQKPHQSSYQSPASRIEADLGELAGLNFGFAIFSGILDSRRS
jgi:hypothetical protein